MQNNMMHAHAMATMGKSGFYLDISGKGPELISADGAARLPLEGLPLTRLQATKNLAHDQYVNAMLNGAMDLDSHRATLNFLSRQVQKYSTIPAPLAVQERAPRPPRRRRDSSEKRAA